jgi:hypothetical protein
MAGKRNIESKTPNSKTRPTAFLIKRTYRKTTTDNINRKTTQPVADFRITRKMVSQTIAKISRAFSKIFFLSA